MGQGSGLDPKSATQCWGRHTAPPCGVEPDDASASLRRGGEGELEESESLGLGGE